jgi:arsenate reductase (glutaredoxin)
MTYVYGIKSCGSVQKALRFLDAHKIAYTFHDFKTAPVGAEKIDIWRSKVPLSTLLNTKGTTYRTLGLKELNLNEEGVIQWLCSHNLLLKRPIIEYKEDVIVGYDESKYEGIFLT